MITAILAAAALLAPTPGGYETASRLAPKLECAAKLADARKVMAPAGEPQVKVVEAMTFLTWERAAVKDGPVCSVALTFRDGRLTAIVDACVGPPDFAERFAHKRYCE